MIDMEKLEYENFICNDADDFNLLKKYFNYPTKLNMYIYSFEYPVFIYFVKNIDNSYCIGYKHLYDSFKYTQYDIHIKDFIRKLKFERIND